MNAPRRRAARRKLLLLSGSIAVGGLIAPLGAAAQSGERYPARVVKFISPLAAGGSTDRVGRLIASGLQEHWQQSTVVENKPGASGMIAAEHVARARGDAYTALFAQVSLVQAPSLFQKVPYDLERDFSPVSLVGTVPVMLVVRSDSPYRSLQEYLTAARNPATPIKFGSFGVASSFHIYGETLARDAKAPLVHVPYKGEAPAIADVLAGHLDSTFSSVSSARPLIEAGKLRPLAVVGKRVSALPDVPSFAELGFPRLDVRGWFGVVMPADVPPDAVQEMSRAIRQVIRRKDVSDAFQAMGGDLIGSAPDEFAAFLKSERKKWHELVTEAGIKAQ